MLVCCARKDGRIRVYSLCVAGGPRHPLGLLQYDDGSRYVIRRALDLVRRQSQELRSAVREFQRQIRAAGMVTVGATSHHTSHKIGHRRFHPREHDPAWVQATRLREFTPAGQTPARRRSFAAWEADTRRPWILIQLSSPSVNTEIKDPYKQAESAARWSCDKPVAAGGFGPTGIARGAAYRSQCSRSLAGNPRVRIASWARCCRRRADPRLRRVGPHLHSYTSPNTSLPHYSRIQCWGVHNSFNWTCNVGFTCTGDYCMWKYLLQNPALKKWCFSFHLI